MVINLATDGVTLVSTSRLQILGSRFVDPQGRHVLLHGINVVNKNRHEDYIVDEGPGFYTRLRDWGFNAIRLGVIWDGLEPEPGPTTKHT